MALLLWLDGDLMLKMKVIRDLQYLENTNKGTRRAPTQGSHKPAAAAAATQFCQATSQHQTRTTVQQ
jgi:hypothetical protein